MRPASLLSIALLGLLTLEPWQAEARAAERLAGPPASPSARRVAGDADWGPSAPPKAALHRGDLLGIELARSARPLALEGLAPRAALGLPALDALARDLGGARFEPEFPELHAATTRTTAATDPADDLARFWLVHLPEGADLSAALRRFDALPEVERAFPIARAFALAVPNDSLWNASYHFFQPSRRDLHAPEAWNLSTGDTGIVVAIIDTGVLWSHPDLAQQIWSHPLERSGFTGLDDDANGFIDDVRGWDFVDVPDTVRLGEDGRTADNDPADFSGHGTAVAGLVGARTNNHIGVAGTAWNVRLMPLRIGWSTPANGLGESDVRYIAQAVRYATRMGAHVINLSFTTESQPDLIAAVDAAIAAGITIVTASGNFGVTHYLALREDVIAVGATDANDEVAYFSTSGPWVDLSAPGYQMATTVVFKTDLGQTYPAYATGASGTSFSAPLVSGAVALLQAQQTARRLPPLTPTETLMRLMDTADDIAALNRNNPGYGTGRLNLYRALADPPTSRRALTRARLAGPAVAMHRAHLPALVVAATRAGWLLAFDGALGATEDSARLSGAPAGGVAAVALGDGATGLFVATLDGKIHGFDAGLEPLPGWPIAAPVAAGAMCREPLLGDLDGDDAPEILWAGGRDGTVRAWRRDGTAVAGFPLALESVGTDLTLALSDLDGRPGAEIVVGSRTRVIALDSGGAMLPGWPVPEPCDYPVIVAGSGAARAPAIVALSSQRVVALSAGGETLWTQARGSTAIGAPIAADLDLDGSEEIVVLGGFPDRIAVLDSTGAPSTAWQSPILTEVFLDGPVVGNVAPAGRPGVVLPLSGVGLGAFDGNGQVIRSFPKPGGSTVVSLIDDLDQDGRLEVLAASPNDSTLFLYSVDAAPAASRGWPTPRGNYARTGSSLYAPPTVSGPDLKAAAITDLAVTGIRAGGADLSWTRPAGPDGPPPTTYELRFATTEIRPDNLPLTRSVLLTPAAGPPGTIAQGSVEALEEDVTYHFAIRSRGPRGAWSALSNVVAARTPIAPPARVADLRVAALTDTGLTVQWSATGDDGTLGRPARYELRAAETPLDPGSFDGAPRSWTVAPRFDAGRAETAVLTGLERDTRYWLALVAVDDAGFRSPVSNVIDATTLAHTPRGVTDLAVLATTNVLAALSWTAPSGEGPSSRPASYQVRADDRPLTEERFDAAPLRWEVPARAAVGAVEVVNLAGFESGRRYWAAVRAVHAQGANAPLSNPAEVETQNAAPPTISDLRVQGLGAQALTLRWTAIGHARSYRIRASDQPISEGDFDAAPLEWEVEAQAAVGSLETVTIPADRATLLAKHVAVAPVGASGERTNLSNLVRLVPEQIPPGPVSDLRQAGRTDTTISLQWTATGEDGDYGVPASYDVRLSTEPITPDNFVSAPIRYAATAAAWAGQPEQLTLRGLARNRVYYVALQAVDASGNRSEPSNRIIVTTQQVVPARVTNLIVYSQTDSSVTLRWTPGGEDARNGRARLNRFRAALTPITDNSFAQAPLAWDLPALVDGPGQVVFPPVYEFRTIGGFAPNTQYHIALIVEDHAGNPSLLSNNERHFSRQTPPNQVLDLRLHGVSDGAVRLLWTATGDDRWIGRAFRYRIHASPQPLDDDNFDSAPHQWEFGVATEPGRPDSAQLRDLPPGQHFSISIVVFDRWGNRSAPSANVGVTTPRAVPAAVAGLALEERTDSTITLGWAATGAIGVQGRPRRYLIRAAETPIDASTFDAAPFAWDLDATVDAGGAERATLSGLGRERRYWIAVKAENDAGDRSPLSGVLEVLTAAYPPLPVAGITAAGGSDGAVDLSWTATGEDGGEGRPSAYLIRAAESPIDEASFETAPLAWESAATVDAGAVETTRLTGFSRERRYWIAIAAVDHLGHRSPLSATIEAWVGRLASGAGLALAAETQPSRLPVRLLWRAPGLSPARVVRIFDVRGRAVRSLALEPFEEGVAVWDGRDGDGRRADAGLYFARIEDGVTRATARIVLLP